MNPVISVRGVSKYYPRTTALDDVSFDLQEGKVYGLLGRNGSGKTTLMSILTAQGFASRGSFTVFGEAPFENSAVLRRICFVRENQVYPSDAKPVHAFDSAQLFFANWDQSLADRLIREFQIPLHTRIKKLSRGQLSAVGIVIGMASRAEITFFDEPYLGLDAVARQIFYDRLLQDYAETPRTIVLSSHLIDEVANLLEHVLVLDRGRLILNSSSDDVRGSAVNIVGPTETVTALTRGREVIHSESLGRVTSVTVMGRLSREEQNAMQAAGLDLAPVSLQQLVVRASQHAANLSSTERVA